MPNGNYTITGGTLIAGSLSQTIGTFQLTGGTISGTGTLTASGDFDVQAGTIDLVFAGGSATDLNKTGTGTADPRQRQHLHGSDHRLRRHAATRHRRGHRAAWRATSPSPPAALSFSTAPAAVTYTSRVSGAGTLVKYGPGTLTMSGSNTFSGNIVVNNGTLDYSGNSTLPGGNYTIAGGTLNTGSFSQTIGTLQITGGAIIGTGTLTSNGDYNIQAGMVGVSLAGGAAVDLNKTGAGTLILANANTYGGSTTISGGVLQTNISTGIPSGSLIILDGGVLESTGATTFSRYLGTSGATFQFTANGGGFSAVNAPLIVDLGCGVPLTWGTNVGSQIVGTLKFGSPTATSSVDFQNDINLNGADRTIQVDDNPTSIGDFATLSGSITEGAVSAGIVKTGPGLLCLKGSNGYTGVTYVNAGNLQIQNANALGSAGAKTVVAAGAVLSVGGGFVGTVNEPIDLSGYGDGNGASQALGGGTDATFAGTINLVADASIGGTAHMTLSGNIVGTGALTKFGSNRVDLTGATSFTGDTRVAGGVLGITSYALQNSTLNTVAGDTARLSCGSDFTLGGLKGAATWGWPAIRSRLDRQQQPKHDVQRSAQQRGPEQDRHGVLTLAGMNSFTGDVTISAGTLSVGVLAANGAASNLGAGDKPHPQRRHAAVHRRLEHHVQSLDFACASGGVINQSGTGSLWSTARLPARDR